MSRISLARCFAVVGIALAAPVAAQAQVGSAVAVAQNTTASGSQGTRVLQTGMRVALGEVIETNESGRAQLKFSDDTRIVVGPGSSLTIDEYVLASNDTVSSFSVKALGGTFRFISGDSDKNAYFIDTPIATIGVRGTGFDFTLYPDLRIGLTMLDGIVELCRKGGACVLLERVCGLTFLPPESDFEFVRDVNVRNAAWQASFPYMIDQAGLLPDFRLPIFNCGHLTNQRVRTGTRLQNEQEPDRGTVTLPDPPPADEDDEGDGDGGGNGPPIG